MRICFTNTIIIITFLFFTSCTSIQNRSELAFSIADKAKFKSLVYSNNDYAIMSFQKHSIGEKKFISIYIEGDGLSWIDRRTVSNNPTPISPLALKLAVLDQNRDVIYLARPCQYVDHPKCTRKVWTSHQFSKEVLQSYMDVLDKIKKQAPTTQFDLVGYSGGATIALLLGANRPDIRSIRTIAGNLNHTQLSAATKTTPLTGSIPIKKFILETKHIPQTHYYTEQDQVIPASIHKGYKNLFKKNNCIEIKPVESADHYTGWESFWKYHHINIPNCS